MSESDILALNGLLPGTDPDDIYIAALTDAIASIIHLEAEKLPPPPISIKYPDVIPLAAVCICVSTIVTELPVIFTYVPLEFGEFTVLLFTYVKELGLVILNTGVLGLYI
jgi:hypothetical protein